MQHRTNPQDFCQVGSCFARITISVFSFSLLFTCPLDVHADTFGTGPNLFSIDFVTIGDPGNVADTSGDPNPAGAVAYTYRIGKYEISEQMIDKANAQSALDGSPLNITKDTRGPDKPATRISWFEAAKFVNWLNIDAGSSPAYKFDSNGDFQLWQAGDTGYNPANPFRNTQAIYFLPSADEWYKAAFYDPVSDTWFDFPNGSNAAPIAVASGTVHNTAVWNQPFSQGPADIELAGGPSPFGTIAQGGNVNEWQETAFTMPFNISNTLRGLRGSAWIAAINASGLSSLVTAETLASNDFGDIGFRIASIIPEPTTILLAMIASSILLHRRCRI